jgi:hypothetical protein
MDGAALIFIIATLFFYTIGIVLAVRMGRRRGKVGLAVLLVLFLSPIPGLIVLALMNRHEPRAEPQRTRAARPKPRKPLMLSCPACGAPLRENARKCDYCDAEFEWE